MRRWLGLMGLLGVLGFSGVAFSASLSGQLIYTEQAHLGTLLPGMVKKVAVKKGQSVKKGALLLKLDDREYRATLTATSARAAHTALLLEEAQADFDRAEELYERTVLSEVERRQARISLLGAQASAAEAQAAKTRAALQLERSRMLAPFDGLVVAVKAVPGEAVLTTDGGKVLVVVARRDVLALQVLTDAAGAQSVLADGSAQVRVAGRLLPVRMINTAQQAGGIQLLAEFDAPADLTLSAGEAAQLVWGQ